MTVSTQLIPLLGASFPGPLGITISVVGVVLVLGIVALMIRCWRKVLQGMAIVRNGVSGTVVSFSGLIVIPVLHIAEMMDISGKRIEIDRSGEDTREFAAADRKKQVAVTAAEEIAQQALVKQVQAADAERQAAGLHAETVVVTAEAERTAAEKETDAKKMLAEATQAEVAAEGLTEAQVTLSKADALEKEGTAEAKVIELKFEADAKGITQKAEAMKLFDGVGPEQFKQEIQRYTDMFGVTSEDLKSITQQA